MFGWAKTKHVRQVRSKRVVVSVLCHHSKETSDPSFKHMHICFANDHSFMEINNELSAPKVGRHNAEICSSNLVIWVIWGKWVWGRPTPATSTWFTPKHIRNYELKTLRRKVSWRWERDGTGEHYLKIKGERVLGNCELRG